MKEVRKKIASGLLLGLLLSYLAVALPVEAAGASLFFSPGAGTYVIGEKFNVTVKVSSGGVSVNAAEGSISVDKNFLEIVSVSKSGSVFSLWTTEPSVNKTAGTVSFGGGLPPPGFNGGGGKIITITLKAKAVGVGQVRFSSGSVLANDGKGTNVLETMGSASFTVAAKETVPTAPAGSAKPAAVEPKNEPSEIEEYNKPMITSPTHPDQNSWYKNNNVEFKWELPAGVNDVSLVFSKDSAAKLDNVSDGLISGKIYNNVESGIWYLKVKFKDAKRWGTIGDYRVMIDTVNPLPFSIEVEQKDAGNWPELYFKTTDQLSGVQSYEVYVNSLEDKKFNFDEDQNKQKLSIQTTDLAIGEHTALIKAIDKAGNETNSTVKFVIEPIETPVIKNYPKEIKPSDQFFVSGTALENLIITVFISDEAGKIQSKTTHSDKNGNWFAIYDSGLNKGRYFAWVEGANINGLKSRPSEKVSFLVTEPVFARLGSFVINYFTVIVSLLFMIILIIVLVILLAGWIRKKLKKETVEVEDVLHKNMLELKRVVREETGKIIRMKKTADIAQEGEEMQETLNEEIDATERKIFKEIKDVEKLLK